MKRRIRHHGIVMFFSLIAIIIGARFCCVSYKNEGIDYFTDIIGAAFIMLGFILRISSRGYKAEHSCCGKMLLTTGPYALSRNPMYLGVFLIGVGMVLVVFKLWMLIIFMLVFGVFYCPQIIREEALLQKRFGKEFENYKKSVPVLLPTLTILLRGRCSKLLPIKPEWIKREVVSLLVVSVAIVLFEVMEEKVIEGHSFIREIVILGMIIYVVFLSVRAAYIEEHDSIRRRKLCQNWQKWKLSADN